jgi:hypothetical protein
MSPWDSAGERPALPLALKELDLLLMLLSGLARIERAKVFALPGPGIFLF